MVFTMSFDACMGIVLTALALVSVLALTLWSRKIIEQIYSDHCASLKNIKKDSEDGSK